MTFTPAEAAAAVCLRMLTFAKKYKLIRLTQHNDWVILLITGCIFLLLFVLRSLQREASAGDFLLQKFPDATNSFLSWAVISVVYSVMLATALSQYVPTVPKILRQYQVFGFELNKLGFTFSIVSLFYLIRTGLGFLLFSGTGASRRWERFYFSAGKFYFVFTMVLIVLNVVQFYFNIERKSFLEFSLILLASMFLFKNVFYLMQPEAILPQKWYYKFLYICTLQIVPVLVLWKVLFV